MRSAGAFEGLLHVVGGEDTEGDGHSGVTHHLAYAVGDAVAHEVEVRSPAANHRAERDDRLVATGVRERARGLIDG